MRNRGEIWAQEKQFLCINDCQNNFFTTHWHKKHRQNIWKQWKILQLSVADVQTIPFVNNPIQLLALFGAIRDFLATGTSRQGANASRTHRCNKLRLLKRPSSVMLHVNFQKLFHWMMITIFKAEKAHWRISSLQTFQIKSNFFVGDLLRIEFFIGPMIPWRFHFRHYSSSQCEKH